MVQVAEAGWGGSSGARPFSYRVLKSLQGSTTLAEGMSF